MPSPYQTAFKYLLPALALLLALNAYASLNCDQMLGGRAPALTWNTKADVLKNTPGFFKKIPWPSGRPITKLEAVEKYAQRYGKRMMEEEAQAVIAYLRNPAISQDPMSATALLQATLGSDNPAFDILTNVSAGIQVLMKYDSQHGTDYAVQAGNKIIRELLPNPRADNYPDLFKDVSLAAITSKNPRAVADYIAAVSESPALAGFIHDKNNDLRINDLLEAVWDLGPKSQPDPSQILDLLKERLRYAEKSAEGLPDPEKNKILRSAQIEALEVSIYFEFIGDLSRARTARTIQNTRL